MAGTANGASWMIAFLAEQKALGHHVHAVISGADGTVAPALDRLGIPWTVAEQNFFLHTSPLAAWRAVWRLANVLRSLRPDVLQMHLFSTVMIGRMAAWMADVPVRISMNTGPYYLQSPILSDIEVGLAWMDTATIASCEFTRRLMIDHGVPPDQVELIYYAVDQQGFDPATADGSRVRRELGIPADAPVVGQVAHFYEVATNPRVAPPELIGFPLKGHDVILRAAPIVLRTLPETRFVFTGAPWADGGAKQMEEMRELARTLGVSGSVIFTGERSDVPDVLASFDVALQCSRNENVGGSVEALLLARPTIASNVGGLPDAIRHEKTGLLVPPGDPEALAAAILRLLQDRELARRLGEAGRALAIDRFTLARTVADLEQLYARQVAEHPARYSRAMMFLRALLFPIRVGPLAARVRMALASGVVLKPFGLRTWRPVTPAKAAPEPASPPGRSSRQTVARRKWTWPRFPQYPKQIWTRLALRSSLLWRRFAMRMYVARVNALAAVAAAFYRILKRQPAPPATPRARIAQLVAASSGSPWFVEICTVLASRGHDVLAIIDSSPGDLGTRLERNGIRVRRVPMVLASNLDRARLPFYLLQLPISALRVAWILRRERTDIVQSHIFVANILGRLARLLRPTRHVATIAGPRHLEARLTRAVDRRTLWLDDRTVGGCRYTMELYRGLGAREERLAYVYYGARSDRFDPSRVDGAAARRVLGIAPDAPVAGLVAYFYPPTFGPQTPTEMLGTGLKGHENFLDAARLLASRFPSARFVLAGSGASARGERYRQSLVDACRADDLLRDRVLFTGETDDVASLIASFDVAVQCSLSEGLGGTIEALLMEKPVVATSVGGMPESVRHEETGLLVPPAAPAALAEAIERLFRDRAEAARMGRAGRALMLQRFTLDRTVDDLEELYAAVTRTGMASRAEEPV